MKEKLMIAAMALAVASGSFGAAFAETAGGTSLKTCFADIYEIFSVITDGNGRGGGASDSRDFSGDALGGRKAFYSVEAVAEPEIKPQPADAGESEPPKETSAEKILYEIKASIEADKRNFERGKENGGEGIDAFSAGDFGLKGKRGIIDSCNESYSQDGGEGIVQANKILNLVNHEREKAGLSLLALNDELCAIAQMKAKDMAKNNYFSHNSPAYGSAFDMMKEYNINYMAAGENIAKGQKSAEFVMRSWMGSQGHRNNILREKYEEIGVGYAVNEKGVAYWVQLFIG